MSVWELWPLVCFAATSPGRTRSPLRTSLRSLQAVRNSRSLETDECQPADSQITQQASGMDCRYIRFQSFNFPSVQEVQIGLQTLHEMGKMKHYILFSSGASSVRKGSGCWSPLLSMRDSSDRMSAVKRMQRSQSASPCRIPHPAKGYLSVHGRVFASPDRSTTVAWGRNVSSTRRWKVSPGVSPWQN